MGAGQLMSILISIGQLILPNHNNSPLWICLHFSELPLEIFTRSAIGSAPAPIVVVENKKVCCLNQSAKETGAQIGNSMNTVYAISSKVRVFERDQDKESRTIRQLAHWAYQFTPRVSIHPPFSLLLDITGCLKLFKGLHQLKAKIIAGTESSGYAPVLSTGHTCLSALFLAKAAIHKDYEKKSCEKKFLEGMSIEFMEVEPWIIKSLYQTGIKNMETLVALPSDELSKRYGTSFVNYLQQLTGDVPSIREFISPRPRFFSEINFLDDISGITPLLFSAKRLISELCSFLTGRHFIISELGWQIKHRNHPPRTIHISLARAENNFEAFLTLTRLQLENISDISEIDSLCLAVKDFFPAGEVSQSLFKISEPLISDKTSLNDQSSMLINQLNIKLGADACFGLSLANDYRPEQAWKPVRFASNEYWAPEVDERGNPRPTYLLKQPRRLRAVDSSPSLNGDFELVSGPERIEFGWWDNRNSINEKPAPRDYYMAQHPSGSLYWIYQYQGRWYLHGIFS